MHNQTFSGLAVVAMTTASFLFAQEPVLRVNVTNELEMPRARETVELPAGLLQTVFPVEALPRVRMVEAGVDREILTQAVDEDGDGRTDRIVFQAAFEPRGTRTFVLTLGGQSSPRREDFRVYGRFVRERFDDFAWENDLVAHRVYGPALETWEKEPLTSSGVDVWVKGTRALVVNDWYMVDDYHRDHGEGGDFYSVGPSRGCGGSGIWADGRLTVSKNFRHSRVLANGPIRLVFELRYEPWETGAGRVSETKRITLDAGSRFNRIESVYAGERTAEMTWAVGIKKAKGAEVRVQRDQGLLRTWEPLKEPNGHLGCAVVVDPARLSSAVEADGNVLFLGSAKVSQGVVYHVGSAWDKGGEVSGAPTWDVLVEDFARRLRSPLHVQVLPH